ncbi:uracil-DNA glycosylase family protein [Rudaea sp.]|uniref:uracil-DNA glycosylase family protein n=1 Tax=Rudaea sp. TaxID=2136325 RepID=UPI00321F9D80
MQCDEHERRERDRLSYKPAQVRILFVGEAPPASGRFFYHGDSGLYRAVRTTFLLAFPHLDEVDFLAAFQTLGCYLIDLCNRPVDNLDAGARAAARSAGIPLLRRRLAEYRPRTVVILTRSIAPCVRQAQTQAHWSGVCLETPYPGRWKRHREVFASLLVPMLQAQLSIRKLRAAVRR